MVAVTLFVAVSSTETELRAGLVIYAFEPSPETATAQGGVARGSVADTLSAEVSMTEIELLLLLAT